MEQVQRAALLRAELLRRTDLDQAARNARDPNAMARVDGDKLPWLKHADEDPAFQRRCLGMLIAAVAAGEASTAHLAYLTDRVLLAEGKPQECGTQVNGRDGNWFPPQPA
jgi:hypothetical protein